MDHAPCGFCQTRDCDRCRTSIPDAAGYPGSVWTCMCAAQGHPRRRERKITHAGNPRHPVILDKDQNK